MITSKACLDNPGNFPIKKALIWLYLVRTLFPSKITFTGYRDSIQFSSVAQSCPTLQVLEFQL